MGAKPDLPLLGWLGAGRPGRGWPGGLCLSLSLSGRKPKQDPIGRPTDTGPGGAERFRWPRAPQGGRGSRGPRGGGCIHPAYALPPALRTEREGSSPWGDERGPMQCSTQPHVHVMPLPMHAQTARRSARVRACPFPRPLTSLANKRSRTSLTTVRPVRSGPIQTSSPRAGTDKRSTDGPYWI